MRPPLRSDVCEFIQYDTKFVAHSKVDKNKTLYCRSVDSDDPSKTNDDDAGTFDNNIVLLRGRSSVCVCVCVC